jgi:hypothetical protein
MLNLAFALVLGICCAANGPPNPRLPYLILLFGLCSAPVIDIDRINGRYTLLAMFMLVYFVSYGTLDLRDLLLGSSLGTETAPAGSWQILTKTEVVILLGCAMLVLGYRLAVSAAGVLRPVRNPRDWSKSAILMVGAIFWAIGTYTTYRWYVYIVPDTTNDVVRKGLASIGTLTASAYILGQMLQPLGILLIAYASRAFRSPHLSAIVFAIVLLQVGLGFVVDIKGMAMLGGILVVMTAILVDGRLPKAWLAAAVLFVIFVFPVFQAYRTVIHGDRGLARTTVVENIGNVLRLTIAAESKVTTGPDRAQTFLERSSVKGSTEMIVEKTGNGVEFQDGQTLTPLFATFVPKILWSNKPDVPTGQLVNKAFHVTDSDDVFISPSHLGELYWNFGWVGVVVGMTLIGAICGWVGGRFNLAEFRTVARILVTVVTIKQLIVGFEGTIASIYVVWLRSLAGIGLLHLVFARVPVVPGLSVANTGSRGASAERSGERLFPNLMN